ncbi:hypothetical protein N7463_008309 [Penicillium fimorum]|uniref:Uncharacterized protein n=1 Tax=Penicillium fimorum TaxID=1882269 RepID=A0A9W9XNL5_9EURO|nr:hypothetical protein N7463_008309 [Penicillium fimorum]
MYCKVNLQCDQVYIIPGLVNSGQRNIRVSVFVKPYPFCTTISAAPQLFTDRISLLSIFSQPQPKQNFSTLIPLSIYSIPFRLIHLWYIQPSWWSGLLYFLDSRWDPSQGPSDRKFNGYQIGAFPEIRLTAPSPAPTSDQVDPLRTSDSPAERSACRCTSPPGSLSLIPSSSSHCEIHIS